MSMNKFINDLLANVNNTSNNQLKGKYSFIHQLFQSLIETNSITSSLFLLCTKNGIILNLSTNSISDNLSGYIFDIKLLDKYSSQLVISTIYEYIIVLSDIDYSDKTSKLIHSLVDLSESNFNACNKNAYLLDCLDNIDNGICIYDKNATLLYGNKKYIEIMHIPNKESIIGMNLSDIVKSSGIKVQPLKNKNQSLKIFDILKNGNKVLNWEVQVNSESASSNQAEFLSNNMYPIKNSDGSIEGVIEVLSSHNLNLNKVKNLMGLQAEYTFDSIIGSSHIMRNTISTAKEYSESPYNLLILGESGTGKELFAEAIHNESSRRNGPFVALNCSSFPENLIESELFGYVAGSFTGASKNGQMGKFELANGGTLFLDEVGELPLHFQSKLLRVLETHKITRIGGNNPLSIDVRILAATNRNLEEMVEQGLFRKDLFYRLQVLSIEIPPLRERPSDTLLLADTFLKQVSEINNEPLKFLDSEAQLTLTNYNWPGNVRELRNVIHRATILSKSEIITKDILESAMYNFPYTSNTKQSEEVSNTNSLSLDECFSMIDEAYIKLITTALSISNGNKSVAAQHIGVSRRTLYRMMQKYNL